MSKVKELLRDSSHYMMGRGFAIMVGFVSFPVWARLLSVSDYGILNLAQRFTLFAVAISKLGLQNAVLRFHEELSSNEDSLRRLYSTTLFGSTIGALGGTILCALFFSAVPATWIQPAISRALLVASGLVFMRTAVSPIYGFLRVEGRTLAYNILDGLTRLLSLIIGVALVLTLGRRPEIMLTGLIVAEGLAIGAALIFLVPRHRLSLSFFDRPLLKTSLVFAMPLAWSELATTLLGSADRALVQFYLGSQQLGYYAAACAMAVVLQEGIQIPLNLALVPIYVKIWHTEGAQATSRFVSSAFNLFLMGACGLTAFVFAASRELIVFVSSSKYAPAAPMLGPLVAGYMFFAASVFLAAGFWVQKKTIKMARLVVVAFVVKCVLNVILLPRIGLAGAVIPNMAGFMILACLYGWSSHELLPIHISFPRLAVYIALAVVAAFLGSSITVPHLLFSLAARSLVTLGVYTVGLCVVDSEARHLVVRFLHKKTNRLKSAA